MLHPNHDPNHEVYQKVSADKFEYFHDSTLMGVPVAGPTTATEQKKDFTGRQKPHALFCLVRVQ